MSKCKGAQQQFKDECDINHIMQKYQRNGLQRDPISGNRVPLFGDFSELPDYQEALHIVEHAREEFMRIPAETRLRFGNNPGLIIDFLKNPENRAEAEKLGLLEPKKPDPIKQHADAIAAAIDKKTTEREEKKVKSAPSST